MQKLIKDKAIAKDPWTLLKIATGPEILTAVPGKNLIVPLQFWRDYGADLEQYGGNIALWLDSDETVSEIGDVLSTFPLIALNFPVYADGRSYTNARELRERFAYEGEVRAIGDVLRDQLYYMSRCGFNAFSLRHDQDPDACIKAFDDFKTGYQSTVMEPTPLFRRR
jgi:uncharacterized protein (DUF934 family)